MSWNFGGFSFNPTVFTPINDRRLAGMTVIFPVISVLAGQPVFQETPLLSFCDSADNILRGPGTSAWDALSQSRAAGLLCDSGALHLPPVSRATASPFHQVGGLLRQGCFLVWVAQKLTLDVVSMLAVYLNGEPRNTKKGGRVHF